MDHFHPFSILPEVKKRVHPLLVTFLLCLPGPNWNRGRDLARNCEKQLLFTRFFFDLPLAQNFWTTYSINRHCSAGFFFSTRTWLERSMSFAQKSRYTRRVKAPGNERPNLGTSFPWESIFLGDCSLPGWQERVESRLGAKFVVPDSFKIRPTHPRTHPCRVNHGGTETLTNNTSELTRFYLSNNQLEVLTWQGGAVQWSNLAIGNPLSIYVVFDFRGEFLLPA